MPWRRDRFAARSHGSVRAYRGRVPAATTTAGRGPSPAIAMAAESTVHSNDWSGESGCPTPAASCVVWSLRPAASVATARTRRSRPTAIATSSGMMATASSGPGGNKSRTPPRSPGLSSATPASSTSRKDGASPALDISDCGTCPSGGTPDVVGSPRVGPPLPLPVARIGAGGHANRGRRGAGRSSPGGSPPRRVPRANPSMMVTPTPLASNVPMPYFPRRPGREFWTNSAMALRGSLWLRASHRIRSKGSAGFSRTLSASDQPRRLTAADGTSRPRRRTRAPQSS